MKSITRFNAVYCSGLVIPNQATIAALCLIFDKIFLPNNIENVIDFAKRYKIKGVKDGDIDGYRIKSNNNNNQSDPFKDLTEREKETAFSYIEWSRRVGVRNFELFDEDIFETQFFEGGKPMYATLIEKGVNGQLNAYKVYSSSMSLIQDDNKVEELVDKGYVPVVGAFHSDSKNKYDSGSITAKQLASILAMQSIEMFFPAPQDAPAELILEARDKLSEHLPVFWSSMLKLSVDLRLLIESTNIHTEIIREGMNLVDTSVRPALIDLNDKIEKDRKLWFYRIFGHVYKGLKVIAGKPPVSQEQLIRSSLLLGTDTAMEVVSDYHNQEQMKNSVGLTYLLELDALKDKAELKK